MSVGPLPASSIDRWVHENLGDDPDEAADVRACFRAMDAVFLGREKPPEPEKPNGRAFSLDLFDALF